MGDKRIRDFAIEDRIDGFFSVRRKSVRDYTRGQYVLLELGDNSGRIPGVMWSPNQFALAELEEGMVVKIRGNVGEYRDRLQLIVDRIRLALDDEYSIDDILQHSSVPVEQRRAKVLSLGDKIVNGYVKSLFDSFFEDEEFFDRYLTAAAGKLWHHAYVGGLSEHSINVTELVLQVATNYDFLDRDYLIFGGLLHDAGKITQYSLDASIDYTDEGRLVGHINDIDSQICGHAAKIEAFPSSLLMKLRHMILSHHGELQYGSPVVPQMPEAFILNFCDEIDSKMGAITRIRNKGDGTGWSEYVKLLNRFLYFGESQEEK